VVSTWERVVVGDVAQVAEPPRAVVPRMAIGVAASVAVVDVSNSGDGALVDAEGTACSQAEEVVVGSVLSSSVVVDVIGCAVSDGIALDAGLVVDLVGVGVVVVVVIVAEVAAGFGLVGAVVAVAAVMVVAVVAAAEAAVAAV